MSDILSKLYEVLQERKKANPNKSYVASLYAKGEPKIASKITEEAQETAAESLRLEKGEDAREALISETADLLFHTLVMLAHHNVRPEEVLEVLEKRFGTGGLEEKASRLK